MHVEQGLNYSSVGVNSMYVAVSLRWRSPGGGKLGK